MKAISLWQPWASALFTLLKPDETRSWVLPEWAIGVPIAIQAAKRDTPAERLFWNQAVDATIDHADFREIGIGKYTDLPRGVILGTVIFGSPVQTHRRRYELPKRNVRWGDYSDDRWAWPVLHRDLFPTPIPCVGRQKFFDWNPAVAA